MSHLPRKSLISITLLAAMSVTAAACSSGGSSGGSSGTGTSADASLNSMTPQQLYPLAKKEGEVTFYTSTPSGLLSSVEAAFEKAYPGVKLNALSLSGNTPTTRIETEAKAGSHIADVVAGADDPVLLAQQNLIDTSFAPQGYVAPPGLKAPAGVLIDGGLTNVIGYNPATLKKDGLQPPTSYEDFTKPQWRGKFSIDPTTADMLNDLEGTMGRAKVLSLVKQIGANKPVFVTSHSLALAQVSSGTIAASASIYGYKALPAAQQDPSVFAFVNPDPLPITVAEVGIVIDAPHPAAARLYLDWDVSEAGQQAMSDLGIQTSFRTDVTGQQPLYDPSKWSPALSDPLESTADFDQDLQDYRNALGYTG